jgi:hypothetical protein
MAQVNLPTVSSLMIEPIDSQTFKESIYLDDIYFE